MVQPTTKRLVTEAKVAGHVLTSITSPGATKDAFDAAILDVTHAGMYPESQTITYNPDGSVATVTENGVTTTYTYNSDGTVATDTRAGVTRNYTYTNGNLTGIEAA